MPDCEALKENPAMASSLQMANVPHWFLSYSLERGTYACAPLVVPAVVRAGSVLHARWEPPSFPSPCLVVWNLGWCQSPPGVSLIIFWKIYPFLGFHLHCTHQPLQLRETLRTGAPAGAA